MYEVGVNDQDNQDNDMLHDTLHDIMFHLPNIQNVCKKPWLIFLKMILWQPITMHNLNQFVIRSHL